MRKIIFISLLVTLVISCSNKKSIPDVSDVKVDLHFGRFDKDFFAIDSNNILPGLNQLHAKYPLMTSIFLQSILGLDSANTIAGVKDFLHRSKGLEDTVNVVFSNAGFIETDFKKAFQFVKHYFPSYKTPKQILAIIGPVDALAQNGYVITPNFLGPDFLGISLQFYLGKNFSVYNDPFFVENVAPAYRSRRFSKEYIIADGMQLIVDDMYPDQSKGKPLVEQMVERGKQWWLLDKFLPTTADSVKTGYTQAQLDWCSSNEGLIWGYIVKNEDLYSVNPAVIQTYIGEGPFTQGFSQELSPGNLGQWIGWQIVKKYADKNSSLTPADIMKATPKEILDGAKYRPK